ncbi:hypothetical protein ACHAWC_003089 [Mediolabrus comicus]
MASPRFFPNLSRILSVLISLRLANDVSTAHTSTPVYAAGIGSNTFEAIPSKARGLHSSWAIFKACFLSSSASSVATTPPSA